MNELEAELKRTCAVLRMLQLNEREFHRRATNDGLSVTAIDLPTFYVNYDLEMRNRGGDDHRYFWARNGDPYLGEDGYRRLFPNEVADKIDEIIIKQTKLLEKVFNLTPKLVWLVLEHSDFVVSRKTESYERIYFNQTQPIKMPVGYDDA